jgi:hypothetical protein
MWHVGGLGEQGTHVVSQPWDVGEHIPGLIYFLCYSQFLLIKFYLNLH